MGVADIDGNAGEGSPTDGRGAGTQQAGLAHVDADVGRDVIGAVHDHFPGPGQRTDHELLACLHSA